MRNDEPDRVPTCVVVARDAVAVDIITEERLAQQAKALRALYVFDALHGSSRVS
jgi:hypothetical protein